MKKMCLVIMSCLALSMIGGCATEGKKEESDVYEFYVVDDDVRCTKTEWETFYRSIEETLGSKIERIWLNGWNDEAGVQGISVDQNVIYNSLCMLDKEAYINNSYEDILLAFNKGEKVVLIGEDLITDEKTYKIGDEEYEIIGVFGKGPMAEHMQVPVEVYPNLETIDVFIIYFSETLTEVEIELLNAATENSFGGKMSLISVK